MDKNKKRNGLIGEFKEFISRGSVMDLAVGIIIGGAFTTIVNSLVKDVIMPVIGLLLGGINFEEAKIINDIIDMYKLPLTYRTDYRLLFK